MSLQRCLLVFVFTISVTLSNSVVPSEKGLLDFIFSPCKCRCGIPNREARLVGGEYLRGHEFPWAALMQILGDKSLPATLINDKYLVTAASNLIGLTPLDIKVTLGQFDRCFPDISSSNVSVEKLIIHPDFSPGNRAYDIALIKVSTPIKFERRVSPICLATPNTQYLGQVATVFGWTAEDKTEVPSTTCRPRKLGLPILGREECLGAAFESQYVSLDKGCVGVVGSINPVCKIDAGGAVMFRSRQGVYELIGILTDKNECGPKPSVALYTTINDHIFWITQNTRDACYCFKT